eukprot:2660-Amphidinium_carterae.1
MDHTVWTDGSDRYSSDLHHRGGVVSATRLTPKTEFGYCSWAHVYRAEFLAVVCALEEFCVVVSDCNVPLQTRVTGRRQSKGRRRNLEKRAKAAS